MRIVDPYYKNKPIEMLSQFDYDQRIRGAICSAPEWLGYVKEEKWNSQATKQRKYNNDMFRNKINEKAKEFFK